MSIPKSDRSESAVQFLYTARELEIKTKSKCINLPKRYTFYGLQELSQIASQIHNCVKLGNSIYPLNQHEVQTRRDYFIEAKAYAELYVSKLEILNEVMLNNLNKEIIKELSILVKNEIRLISGELESARERYSKLPGYDVNQIRHILDAYQGIKDIVNIV